MAEESPNLVLEHLRAIRGSVERTEYDIKDLKFRWVRWSKPWSIRACVLTALKPVSI